MTTLPLTLLGVAQPEIGPWEPQRIELDPCCWVEHCADFLVGADTLFVELESTMDWHRGRRLMYGTWYDEPRRSAHTAAEGCAIPAAVEMIRSELTNHYQRGFEGLFCNFYESGRDSVAWHADRIGRTEIDPLVAIVSLGGPRTFAMRPQQGGPGLRLSLRSGDLLVMGGATQHHWEHSVPKTAAAAPRMSVTMRAGGPPIGLRV